jgi:hypothetical protein
MFVQLTGRRERKLLNLLAWKSGFVKNVVTDYL